MAKEVFMVANSGQEGYMYSPMFFINGIEAARKVAYWESIEDRACLVIYRVNNDVYHVLKDDYNGKCTSGEMSDLEDVYGFEPQKDDIKEEIDGFLSSCPFETDLFQKMGLESESMGAALARMLNIRRR